MGNDELDLDIDLDADLNSASGSMLNFKQKLDSISDISIRTGLSKSSKSDKDNFTKTITADLMNDLRKILDKDLTQKKPKYKNDEINTDTTNIKSKQDEADDIKPSETDKIVFARKTEISDYLLKDIPDFINSILDEKEKIHTFEETEEIISPSEIYTLFSENQIITKQQELELNNGTPLGVLLTNNDDPLFEFMSECVYSTKQGYVLDEDYIYSSNEEE